jgi:hypothetical protein
VYSDRRQTSLEVTRVTLIAKPSRLKRSRLGLVTHGRRRLVHGLFMSWKPMVSPYRQSDDVGRNGRALPIQQRREMMRGNDSIRRTVPIAPKGSNGRLNSRSCSCAIVVVLMSMSVCSVLVVQSLHPCPSSSGSIH